MSTGTSPPTPPPSCAPPPLPSPPPTPAARADDSSGGSTATTRTYGSSSNNNNNSIIKRSRPGSNSSPPQEKDEPPPPPPHRGDFNGKSNRHPRASSPSSPSPPSSSLIESPPPPPPPHRGDFNGKSNRHPRASSPSSPSPPSSSLIESPPPPPPPPTATAAAAAAASAKATPTNGGSGSNDAARVNVDDNDDFFARNKLSALDKLMCDDVAQSLLAAQGYERAAGGRYAWQGWCSYSVLLVPTKERQRQQSRPRRPPPPSPPPSSQRQHGITDTNSASNRTTKDSEGEEVGQGGEVGEEDMSKVLLQFRPPHHAIDPATLCLARAVYGDALVPRLVYAGDLLLWPRAVPPARELFVRHRPAKTRGTGGGRGGGGGDGEEGEGWEGKEGEDWEGKQEEEEDRYEVMQMDRLCVVAATLLPGVPYAVVQPGREGRRRGTGMGMGKRGKGGTGTGSVVVLTQEEMRWQRELVRGFAGFMARGWRGCGVGAGAGAGAGADAVVPDLEMYSSSQQQQQVSVSSLMKASGGSSSLRDRIPAKLAQLCAQLPTSALRQRAERVRKTYAEMGLDRHGAGVRVTAGRSPSSRNHANRTQEYERKGVERDGNDRSNTRPPPIPLTLNHGDLVPGNILVDPATGRLTGVVDWAEAEVGWWGLGLYGVEFLLGFVESARRRRSSSSSSSSSFSSSSASSKTQGRGENDVEEDAEEEANDDDAAVGNATTVGVAWGAEAKGGGGGGGGGKRATFEWTYYAQAEELRRLFWEEVERGIGGAGVFGEPGVRRAVEVVRDVGVLMWFGFAWDDGKVDRVVNEADDPREVLLLETFLGVGAYGGMEREKAKL